MYVQQRAIATEMPITASEQHTQVQSHRVLLAILFIMGITLMLSLYVYQAAATYAVQQHIQEKNRQYAREQRMLAQRLQEYAIIQSMDEVVHRARAAGYGPPTPSQIKYVFESTGPTPAGSATAPIASAQP